MLFSTFYFSGTGNTKWAVGQFKDIVIKNGHQAELYCLTILKSLVTIL